MVLMPGAAADLIQCCASLINHLHRA